MYRPKSESKATKRFYPRMFQQQRNFYPRQKPNQPFYSNMNNLIIHMMSHLQLFQLCLVLQIPMKMMKTKIIKEYLKNAIRTKTKKKSKINW